MCAQHCFLNHVAHVEIITLIDATESGILNVMTTTTFALHKDLTTWSHSSLTLLTENTARDISMCIWNLLKSGIIPKDWRSKTFTALMKLQLGPS